MSAPRQFDHDKLQVYQLELEFIAWVTELFAEEQASKTPRLAEVLDQLDRASLSALLNTAEGNGRRATQQRVRFFDDARGSATECAACLDVIVAKKACKNERVLSEKDMLLSVVSILSALITRFEGATVNHRHAVLYLLGREENLHSNPPGRKRRSRRKRKIHFRSVCHLIPAPSSTPRSSPASWRSR